MHRNYRDKRGLTKREAEVFEYLGRTQANNEELSLEFGVLLATMKNYVLSITRKLGVRNRAELILEAFKQQPEPELIDNRSDSEKIVSHIANGGAWNDAEPGGYVK